MKATLLRHCQTRRVVKVAVATSLGLTSLITGQFVHASSSLPAQDCGTPPCMVPTTPTTPQPLPDATTTSSSATTAPARVPGGRSSATGGGAVTPRSKGSLAITGGDIAGMLLIGTVLVGSGATAVVLGRRRRRAGHYG